MLHVLATACLDGWVLVQTTVREEELWAEEECSAQPWLAAEEEAFYQLFLKHGKSLYSIQKDQVGGYRSGGAALDVSHGLQSLMTRRRPLSILSCLSRP